MLPFTRQNAALEGRMTLATGQGGPGDRAADRRENQSAQVGARAARRAVLELLKTCWFFGSFSAILQSTVEYFCDWRTALRIGALPKYSLYGGIADEKKTEPCP
jgi:hypothetical protein